MQTTTIMRQAFVFSLLLIPVFLLAQRSNPFPGTYVMEGYLLQEDTLMLKARETVADSLGWLEVYSFTETRDVTYELDIPDGMGICGNGMFYVEEADYTYRKRRGILSLRVIGGHMIQDSFRFQAKYDVEPVSDTEYRLVLRKVRQKIIKPEWQIPDQISADSGLQERTPTGLAPGVY